MPTFSDEESDLLDRIAIDMELDRLTPLDRALLVCRTTYDIPDDYAGPWPPEYPDIGTYAGRRYAERALSGSDTQRRTARVLETWRRRRHQPTSPSSTSLTPRAD